MWRKTIVTGVRFLLLGAAVWSLSGCGQQQTDGVELLNVSYDPTRELWRDLNEKFIPPLGMDHGGSPECFLIKCPRGVCSMLCGGIFRTTALAVVLLVLSFAMLGAINLLERWSKSRAA
jgi:hypothetical protein